MNEFKANNLEMKFLIAEWEPKLLALSTGMVQIRRNSQLRSIKQIVGHMVDSASNNTHRIIHLQYQPSPLIFPDYANMGVNDKWIAIQNYQNENWHDLVKLWRYINLHLVHVIENLDPVKLNNQWISAMDEQVSLKEMVVDYLRHFKLHLNEIDELIDQQ
jgi:hypothetical protein